MRIAAPRLSPKPLLQEVPVCCGMLQQQRLPRFRGDICKPLHTGCRSDVPAWHPASPPAVPDRHFNYDRMSGAVMSDSASGGWLNERPDRSDLVLWLAINAAHGNEFLIRALTDLLGHGSLSQAQEEAVRRCRLRVLLRQARFWPSSLRKMGHR